jgi:hypothetical protein
MDYTCHGHCHYDPGIRHTVGPNRHIQKKQVGSAQHTDRRTLDDLPQLYRV